MFLRLGLDKQNQQHTIHTSGLDSTHGVRLMVSTPTVGMRATCYYRRDEMRVAANDTISAKLELKLARLCRGIISNREAARSVKIAVGQRISVFVRLTQM